MSAPELGPAQCDRCGSDIGNAAVDKAISVHALTAEGRVVTLHLGLACEGKCAAAVLADGALAYRQDTNPVTFYNPDPWSMT